MKTQKTTQAPSNFLFFDTETKGEINPDDMAESHHYLWFGYATAFRYEHHKRTRECNTLFTSVASFWKVLRKRLDPSRPLYVFAHNLGFDLTIVDFWEYCDKNNIQFEYAVLDDPPTFFTVIIDECKVCFVDTLNYWRCSLADLGKSFGVPKLAFPAYDQDIETWYKYCQTDVEIIATAVTSLIDYLQDNDLGKFCMTAPSIAMATFKHRFMTTEIYVHDNIHSLDLERDSYYGGLVNCYFIGKAKRGTIHNLDVNSLYPSVMLNEFPTKLVAMLKSPTVRQFNSAIRNYGVCARVEIVSPDVPYPKRIDGKLLEVCGEFTTALCGPELKRAWDNGHVKKVQLASLFELGDVFTEYVEYLWSERLRYKKAGDDVKQTFCKLLMNSLYGKFGQRGYEWQPITTESVAKIYQYHGVAMPAAYRKDGWVPSILWAQSKWFPAGLPEPITVRAVSGVVEMRVAGHEHYESFPAIAGFVTSYARERLRALIDIAGADNVYYCDTDSLFVNTKGRVMLSVRGEIDPNKLGALKEVSETKEATFYGPKDYLFGEKETIKGIRANAIPISENEWMQNQFEGLKSVLKRERKPYIKIGWIVKRNNRRYNKGLILPNGRTKPFTLIGDEFISTSELLNSSED